jgi:hypothetical protein
MGDILMNLKYKINRNSKMTNKKPIMISLENIDQKRCIPWIDERYKIEIVKKSSEDYKNDDGALAYQEVRYYLKGDITLHFHSDIYLDILVYDKELKRMAADLVNDLVRFI